MPSGQSNMLPTFIVFVSNDTDTVTGLLRFIYMLVSDGRRNLWVEFGTGEKRRLLPMGRMAERMREPLCRVLVKAHVLTGNDVTSRIDTKVAATQEFAEREREKERER